LNSLQKHSSRISTESVSVMLSALQTVASSSEHFIHLIDLPGAVHAVRPIAFSPIRPVGPYFM